MTKKIIGTFPEKIDWILEGLPDNWYKERLRKEIEQMAKDAYGCVVETGKPVTFHFERVGSNVEVSRNQQRPQNDE